MRLCAVRHVAPFGPCAFLIVTRLEIISRIASRGDFSQPTRRLNARVQVLALVATLTALGCGGGGDDDNNPTGPSSCGATNGTVTAQINGASWCATGTITVSRQQTDFIGVAGSGFAGNTAYALVIGIGNATGDGSSLIIGGSTTGGSAAGWGTAFSGGSGNVIITSLTSNRIVGTFAATAVSSSGSGGNLVVTSGRFDVTY